MPHWCFSRTWYYRAVSGNLSFGLEISQFLFFGVLPLSFLGSSIFICHIEFDCHLPLRSFELRRSSSQSLCEPWRILIALDLRHLHETVETNEGKMHMYDLGFRSSHVGWRPCKQRSGPHHKCPDLSIDLSVILRSLVFGPDLIWWTSHWHPWISSIRTLSPIHAFHRLRLRYHQLFHIPFHHAWHLLHALPQWNVLPLKPHLRALLPSLRLSLAMVAHPCNPHQEDTPPMKNHEPMALISIHIGRKTKTIMTTRRSTAWPFRKPFDNRHSAKSWTSRDVTHWNFQWQPCCINKPTTSGWGSWPMGVKCSWSRRVTLLRWCSQLNSSLNFGTKEWISTEWVRQKPGRMGNCSTRPKTPNTQHSKWQTSSTVGSLPSQLTQIHSKNWPICAANWLSSVSNLEKNPTILTPLEPQPPVLRSIQSKLHSCGVPAILHRQAHLHLIHPHCWLEPPLQMHGLAKIFLPPLRPDLSKNGSKSFPFLSQNGKFSMTIWPKQKFGGTINQQRRLKQWTEWPSWWASQYPWWARTWTQWICSRRWRQRSAWRIDKHLNFVVRWNTRCCNRTFTSFTRWFWYFTFWLPSQWLTASTFSRVFASFKPEWCFCQSSMVYDPIQSWSQFWKAARTLPICGVALLPPTINFPDRFINRMLSTSVSPILSICNRSST